MKLIVFFGLIIFLITALFASVHAQTSFTLQNPLGVGTLIELIQKIILGMIRLAVPLAAGLVVWAGVLYMLAGVSAEKVQKATKALTYVVIGFGVLLISAGVVSIIQDVLGVRQPCSPTPPECPAQQICQGNLCVPDPQAPLNTLAKVILFFSNLSGWLFAFTIVAGVAMIILSGITYIFAHGDQEKARRAGKMLMYSAIGVAVASLAWAIVNIVANFLTGRPVFGMLILSEAHAQITSIPRPTIAPTGGPQTLFALYKILQDIVGWLFTIGIVGGVGALIVTGIMYMTAAGNSEKASKATRMAFYTLVGVAVIALAWALVNVVGNFFLGKQLIQ